MPVREGDYVIVRQQAGPLVKAYATDRAGFVAWNRGAAPGEVRKRCGPALARTSRDKLELRLALFGYDGIFFTLTFAPENTPKNRAETKRRWAAFLRRLKRYRERLQKESPHLRIPKEFDYVYRIEHLHTSPRDGDDWRPSHDPGDNWHIHCFLRDADFPPAVVRYLWDWGMVNDEPWTYERVHSAGGYWRLARYLTKEEPDVGCHPWGASKGLSKRIPLPTVTQSRTGRISLPRGAVLLPVRDPGLTPWGVFQYCRYLTS